MIPGLRYFASASNFPEILFIDRGAPDHRALAAGARSDVHVHLLDPRRDALEQIADAVEGRGFKTLHIVAHGAPGLLAFASCPLSRATLADHGANLARIGTALSADAEILLWGCAVGAGAAGEAFVDALSDATGAYVAAAAHRIGAGSAASWALDVMRMPVVAQVPFQPETIANYQGVLANRLYYVTYGEDPSDAGFSYINANGTNQHIDLVSDTTFGLGSSWVETVIDASAGFYFVLEQNIATGGSSTLYRGVLGSNAAPTAAVTFTNPTDADVLGGLQIDAVNHHIYIGYTDYDNSTNFNVQPATTGIIQMDYNAGTGAVTNTTNYLVNEQANPIPADALGYYAPSDFALGDGALFFVQQAFETSNQIYRVDLTTHAVNVVLEQTQFPADWSGGVINDVEIDTTNHLLFFTLHDENQPGTHNGIFSISDTATGATLATQLTLPGISANFSPGDMTFDSVSRVLYVESEETSDGPGNGVPDDIIYAFQVNANGTAVTSLLHTFTVGFGDDPTGTTANIGGMVLVNNVAPTLTGLDPATFQENTANAAPQIIDSAVVFNDADDTDYTGGSLTVSYSAGGGTQDNLSVHNFGNGAGQIGVSGSNVTYGGVTIGTIATNGASGANLVINFTSSTASSTSIDALIQALQYQNTSDTPTATRTISIVVTDPSGGQNSAATSLITVNAENDAPVVTSGGNTSYTELNAAVFANSGLTVTDADSPNLANASVTIANVLTGDELTINGATSGTITGINYSFAGGTLTLTGSASAANYQAALDAVKFDSTSHDPTNGNSTRTLNWQVNDGSPLNNTATASSTIAITAVNDAPGLSVPASYPGTAGNAVTINGISFTDVDGESGSEIATFSAAAGSFSGDVVAGVTLGGTPTAFTLTGTIAALNSYISGNHLSYTTISTQQITVDINDQGNTGGGALHTSLNSQVTLNQPPSTPIDNDNTANAVTEGAGSGTAVGITALSTDSDGGTITYSLTNSAGGFFQIDSTSGIVTVTGTGATGIDYESSAANVPPHSYTITVQTSDGQGGISTQDFTIAVNDVAPSAPADNNGATNTIAEGAAVNSLVGITALATDVNGGAPTYTLTNDANGAFKINSTTGDVSVNDPSKIDYESTGPGHTLTITVQASDGTLTGATQDFTIAVTNANPATPVDTDGANGGSITEGAAANAVVGITASSTDPNGPAVAYSLTNDAGGFFQIGSGTGIVTVTSAGATGINYETAPGHAYSITVQASDGQGGTSTNTFSIAVTDVAPGATGDSYTVDEDTNLAPLAAAGVLINDTDVNGGPLTAVLNAGPAHAASFGLNADGSFSYTPSANYNGPDSFTYHATDGALSSGIVTVNIGVNPVNDVPVLGGLGDVASFTENGSSVRLDANQNATVSDVELDASATHYTGATLTLARNGGANPDDTFAGTGPLDLADSNGLGENLSLNNGATFIGTYSQPGDGTFSIVFNANADATAVNTVMRNIVFFNASDNPPASEQINFTFSDGNGDPGGQAQGSGATPGTVIASTTVNITQVDDAPVLLNVSPSALYGIGSSGVVLSLGLQAFDPDATAPSPNIGLASATVKISVGFVATDQLFVNLGTSGGHFVTPDGDTTNISVSSNAGGTLVLSGTDSVAHYQAILDAVAYRSTAADPTNGGADPNRTIIWEVSDGVLTNQNPNPPPAPAFPETILGFDAPPTVDLDASGAGTGFTTSFTEKGAPVAIVDSDVSITDPDNAALVSVIVVLTNAMSGDSLSIAGSLPVGIDQTIDTSIAGKITLTLSGSASLADYQTALGDVRFSVAGNNPSTIARDITVVANDGGADSNVAHATVNVIAVPDPPVLDLDASGPGSGFTTSFTEKGAPVSIVDTDVSITDPDSTALGSARIVLTNAMPGDILSILGTLPSGIGSAIDTSVPGQIAVTLSGSASLADYQTALHDIQFSVSGDNPSTIARDITVVVNDGSVNSNTAHATINVASIPPNDFDFNGASDILWRTDGFISEWQMNNSQIGGNVGVGMLDASWHFLDTGDFNGDGHADVLWQNTSGQVVLWTLNGQQIIGNQNVGTLDSHWHNEGVGDFNGDGHSDVLWLNDSGQVVIWTMNGAQITGNQAIANVTPDMHVSGLLDTGIDGKEDILWRSTNGQVSLWTMDGATVLSKNVVGNLGLDWNVAGTGDFNGDGHEDVLLRNDNGQVVLWTMNGSQIVSNTSIATVTNDWHIMSVGDYNQDGHSDVLWRNDSGQVVIWEMNGSQIVGNHTVTYQGGAAAPVTPVWTVQVHHYDML